METLERRGPYNVLLRSASAIVAIDLLSKLAAVTANGLRHGPIVPVRNPDFSLGIASASSPIELGMMVTGVVAAWLYLTPRVRDARISGWVAGLVVGGAMSNLIDRAVTGAVHDFLATPWIVFNVADIAVLVGVAGAVYESRSTPSTATTHQSCLR